MGRTFTRDLYQLHKDDWPSSFDQIGEIIIIKLSEVIAKHAKTIGQTLLKHFPNIRLVCEDKGVKRRLSRTGS